VFKNFFIEHRDLENVLQTLATQPNSVIDGSVQIAKIMRDYCFDWTDCLKLARLKFEKYFSNKAKNLLFVYPLDHCIDDSIPFWKLPKRPPHSIRFDVANELHLKFVTSCARLYRDLYNVDQSNSVDVQQILMEYEAEVPPWTPSSTKKIVTDEKKSKDDVIKTASVEYDNKKCAMLVRRVLDRFDQSKRPDVAVLNFEKH
jgi:ubiquitin-activating enzyme E1-like protein 2